MLKAMHSASPRKCPEMSSSFIQGAFLSHTLHNFVIYSPSIFSPSYSYALPFGSLLTSLSPSAVRSLVPYSSHTYKPSSQRP